MTLAALQQAVFDRLDGLRATTLSDVQGVYTVVPQPTQPEDDSAFPFISIGPIISSPADTKTSDGIEALVDVQIWSRSQSALSWRGIADEVYAALQKYALTVTGTNVIDCRFDGTAEFMDPTDGKTWRTVLTFRVRYFLD